jgi:undecaprenyl pyrophosphate phosphatase UppP
MCRSRWFLPAFALCLGVAMLAAMWVGGNLREGIYSFALMAALALLFLLGGRSETIRGLRGDGRDERFASLDMRATAFAGNVVIAAIIIAFLVEMARGHDGRPYSWLGAIAGVAYLAALAVLRWRS